MPGQFDEPPVHDEAGLLTRAFEVSCLVAAGALLVANVIRLTGVGLRWWVAPVILLAGVAADMVSGLVHWAADTWGRDTLPILGPRFLRPFRVHHINPHDFLRRNFIDCNGDVAMLNAPLLAAALWIPLEGGWAPAAVALTAFAAWSLPTNQVHQWAHMPCPPRLVRWLQARGVILGGAAHQQHHVSPYATNYCIATGWCNRWLTRIDAFARLEHLITRLTGAAPRADEARYAEEPHV
jgi:plasmanylethanolamine desaturase